MRKTGRRTLAGIAAIGLGAALIPFVGAGVAQADVTAVGVATPAQAAANYTVTNPLAAGSTITVQPLSTVTLTLRASENLADATQTARFQLFNGAQVVPLTLVAPAPGYVQTNANTIDYSEVRGAAADFDAQATFTAPAAGGEFTLSITGTATIADTSIPITAAAVPAAPAATAATTTGPVRYSVTGGVQDPVPAARVTWNNTAAPVISAANRVVLTAAPSASARVTLNTALGARTVGLNGVQVNALLGGAAATQFINVSVNEGGAYAGYIQDTVDPTLARAFSFTTTGKPATLTLTPVSAAIPLQGETAITAALRDASGNLTQIGAADSVTVSAAPVPAGATATLNGGATTVLDAGNMFDGTDDVAFVSTSATAATWTITGTTAGTLPSQVGATATTIITVSGAVNATAIAGWGVTSPAAVNTGTVSPFQSIVPAGSSQITVGITGGAGNANRTMRIRAETIAGGFIDGVSPTTGPVFKTVTLDAEGNGSVSYTLAGTAITADLTTPRLVLNQVTPLNATVGPTVLNVLQQNPAVTADSATISPTGNMVAQLGSSTSVSVLVANQFRQPQAGWTVRAYRGSSTTTGTLLGSGVTDDSGIAQVAVTNATTAVAGTSETYSFQIQSATGQLIAQITPTLTVLYTATGAISSLTVTTAPASVTVGTTVTQIPFVLVPTDGYVDGSGTDGAAIGVSQATYNPGTGAYTNLANASDNFTLTPVASPATNIVVRAPAGVKLFTGAAPSATSRTLWSGGSQTLTVPNGTIVRVFATATGEHTITMAPVGQTTPTASVRFLAGNEQTDGYNIAVDPAKLTVGALSFGTFKTTVTDVFGNPVPQELLGVSSTGDVLVAGLGTLASAITGDNGTVDITAVALRNVGSGSITVACWLGGGTFTIWDACAPGFVAPPGAPAPVVSAKVDVTIEPTRDATITIIGERSGNMVMVDGQTTGLNAGAEVTPYFRFPGQTSYTAGTGIQKVDARGDFQWSRKTGKKIYVYFEAGTVKSNRIIIQAP